MNDVILGAGQVATAVLDNYISPVKAYDKGEWEHLTHLDSDFLHICIPYSEGFVDIVDDAIEVFNPNVVMVHSTVKPGTTREIGFTEKIYSPIMGRHKDNFSQNIKAYTKLMCGSKSDCDKAMSKFNLTLGYWSGNWDELEYSKIMSTSGMFWNLILQKVIMADCEANGYDFHRVYTEWGKNYNQGIDGTHPDWKRPVYHPDKNPIPGGHCLVPNTELVNNFVTGILRDWVYTKGELDYKVITTK
jgi:hypothetical protein